MDRLQLILFVLHMFSSIIVGKYSSEANYYGQEQITPQATGQEQITPQATRQGYSNDALSYSRTNPQQIDKNAYGLQDELGDSQYFARGQQQGQQLQYPLSENNIPQHGSTGSEYANNQHRPDYGESDNYGAYGIPTVPQQTEVMQRKEKFAFPTGGNTGQQSLSAPLGFPRSGSTGQQSLSAPLGYTDYQRRGSEFGNKQGLSGALRENILPQQSNILPQQSNSYRNTQQQYVYGERRGNLATQQQQTMFMQPRQKSVFLRRENSIPTHTSNVLGYVNNPQTSAPESSTWRTTAASNAWTKKDTSDAETQRQINDLQLQIANTTKQIDALYQSVLSGAKQDEHNVESMVKSGESIEERLKNTSCDSADIRQFREDIKIEKEVRNRMIKLLAKAKMENERKTKALQAVLKYYHPNQTVLNKLGIPASLKQVILTEKIKLLSKKKRVELARRWNLLKKKHRIHIKKKT
eukprot:Seg641.1 transcript_id=Seg641.1/GoldUCD/mRNA.D3Y31 product="hypothetical protein" protein_id=Seg641.1/GoldUCD/D3Y31